MVAEKSYTAITPTPFTLTCLQKAKILSETVLPEFKDQFWALLEDILNGRLNHFDHTSDRNMNWHQRSREEKGIQYCTACSGARDQARYKFRWELIYSVTLVVHTSWYQTSTTRASKIKFTKLLFVHLFYPSGLTSPSLREMLSRSIQESGILRFPSSETANVKLM